MRKPLIRRVHPSYKNGIQKIYRFRNNYGASVIKKRKEDKKWELAVIKFKITDSNDYIKSILDLNLGIFVYEIVYNTSTTNNVLKHLSMKEVEEILDKIEKLPKEKEK